MLKLAIEWSSLLLVQCLFLTCYAQDDPVVYRGGSNGENKKVEGVAGQITDTVVGRGIARAVVQPKSLDDPSPPIPEIAILSNGEGRYTWRLVPGNYEISVSVAGYKGATKRVTVKARQQATLDFVLERAR